MVISSLAGSLGGRPDHMPIAIPGDVCDTLPVSLSHEKSKRRQSTTVFL